MGFPLRLENNRLYIPFFKLLEEGKCRLEHEIFVGCPSGEVLAYRKLPAGPPIEFDPATLLRCRDALMQNGAESWEEIPAGFSGIYRRAMEGNA